MNTTAKIVTTVTNALKNSPTGVSYFGINGYTNKQGEISNVVLNIGASFANAKKKDIAYLQELDVTTLDTDIDPKLLETARLALLSAMIKPNKAQSQAQIDAYTKINEAIKVHNTTLDLYIFGLQVSKNVLVKGEYKTTNKRPLTIAKDFIRKQLKTSKYRQYKVEAQPEQITLSGNSETILVEVVEND